MREFGLLGYPLGHSFSAKYFSRKFSSEKIDATYYNFEYEDIGSAVDILKLNKSLFGFNITIPYKEAIIPFLDVKNEIVEAVQACNCVKIIDGKWEGFNTDVIGFEQSIHAELGKHKNALIFGTGGAAKAVMYVLKKNQIDFKIVSRKKLRSFITYDEITPEIIHKNTLLINTTPLGMGDLKSFYPRMPYGSITNNHFAYDLIYNPEKTLFLEKAEDCGAKIKNGLEMLQIQAEESWRIWSEKF